MANRTPDAGNESERLTRHRWIDPLLTIGPQNALTQTRLAFTEQAAFFEDADGPAVREQDRRALLESLGAELRRSMPGRPQ